MEAIASTWWLEGNIQAVYNDQNRILWVNYNRSIWRLHGDETQLLGSLVDFVVHGGWLLKSHLQVL